MANLPAGFYQTGALPLWPTEALIVLLSAGAAVRVWQLYRRSPAPRGA